LTKVRVSCMRPLQHFRTVKRCQLRFLVAKRKRHGMKTASRM
jgi:hypothetical protein